MSLGAKFKKYNNEELINIVAGQLKNEKLLVGSRANGIWPKSTR